MKLRIYLDRYRGQDPGTYWFQPQPSSEPPAGSRRIAIDVTMPDDDELWPVDVVGTGTVAPDA